MDINTVTIVAQSFQHLPPYLKTTTPGVSCIANDVLLYATSNVQQTLRQFVRVLHLKNISYKTRTVVINKYVINKQSN